MARPARTQQAIVALLEEHGPLSISTLAELLALNRNSVHSAITAVHKQHRVHISGWKRSTGTRGNLGAIYTLGPGTDRRPPQVEAHKEAAQRYRDKYREVIRRKEHASRGKPVDSWLALLGGA